MMSRTRRTNAANATKSATWLSVGSLAAVACGGGASGPTIGWACANADVPNGVAYECTSADPRTQTAAAALGGSYTCPGTGGIIGTAACPPPAEDAPPPDGGFPTDDSAAPGPAQPPEDTSPGDAGVPDSAPPDESDGGGGGNGHGNGNGNGHGKGNPHGTPSGPGGSCGCDADTPPSSPPPSPPPPLSPPYDCNASAELVTCTQPPVCEAGSHASACGACVPDPTTEECVPPSSGGCWVTGGGFIDPPSGQDSFGGNAMPMKSGAVRGQWENVDHGSGMKMHGEPSYLYCRHVDEPGPGADNGPHHDFTINQAYFGGPARVFANNAWSDGYWFDVVVDDHGEGKGAKSGGPDLYHVTVRRLVATNAASQGGPIVYDGQATLSGGNIQLHPPNNGHPATFSTLPSWVALQP